MKKEIPNDFKSFFRLLWIELFLAISKLLKSTRVQGKLQVEFPEQKKPVQKRVVRVDDSKTNKQSAKSIQG